MVWRIASRSSVELTARPTSLRAVSCSTDRVSSPVRARSSLSRRAFSIAITALFGEISHQFDLLLVKRLDFELVQDDYAHDVIAPKHRNAKLRADRIRVAQCITVFRVCLKIRDMNRPSFERNSRGNAMAPWRDGMALDE